MKEVRTQNSWTFELGTQEGNSIQNGGLLNFSKEIDKIHKS